VTHGAVDELFAGEGQVFEKKVTCCYENHLMRLAALPG
jgi:hypothetical protein